MNYMQSIEKVNLRKFKKRLEGCEKTEEAKKFNLPGHKMKPVSTELVRSVTPNIYPQLRLKDKKKTIFLIKDIFQRDKKAQSQWPLTPGPRKTFHSKMFERKPLQKQPIRKIAPPSFLMSVRKGINHPETKFWVDDLLP